MTAARRTCLLLAIAFGFGCTKADIAPGGSDGGSGGDGVQDGGSGGASGSGGAGGDDAPVADETDAEPMDAPAEIAEDTGPDDTPIGNGDADGAVDSSDGNEVDGPTGVMPTAPGQILVSELMADSAAVADEVGEWVEIYNPSADFTYDLNGCSLDDHATPPNTAPITQSFILLPGTYHTIARSTQPGFKPDFVQTTVKFGNDHFDGPSIVCKNVVIADFTYNSSDLLSGHTMSVDPVHLNASEYALPGSWCHSNVGFNTNGGVTDYGTPNLLNPHCPAGAF